MNPGKAIFFVGACILIVYGCLLGAVESFGNYTPAVINPNGLTMNQLEANLEMLGTMNQRMFGYVMLFLTIFSTTVLLGLFYLKKEL